MKILVAAKRVVDPNLRVQVKPDASGIVTEGAGMSVNPFDEIALEEALRLRERGHAAEVVVVSIGPTQSRQQLRTCLAMGADRAILVETEVSLQPLGVSRALLRLVERERPTLVLLGKQSIDDESSQTAQMLAALWGRPQATSVSEVLIEGSCVRVTREVDAGMEVLELDLPAVISADLRLNEPRFVKLPDIVRAKRKPLDIHSLDELAIEGGNHPRHVHYSSPPARKRQIMVEDVPALLRSMRERGVIT